VHNLRGNLSFRHFCFADFSLSNNLQKNRLSLLNSLHKLIYLVNFPLILTRLLYTCYSFALLQSRRKLVL
jgi:hypothetical protein